MRTAGSALNALAKGSALIRRRALTCRRVGSLLQRNHAVKNATSGFIPFQRRTGQTAHAASRLIHPLMTDTSPYDSSHASTSDERRRMKRVAALQQLRAVVAHHGETITSQQRETDVELMYDGVHYLEHVLSSRLENELQQISGTPTDLDVVHGILRVWCHERRNAGQSPIASIEPRIMLDWIDQLASSAATDAQSTRGLAIAPTRETYRYLMDADPTNVEFLETLFERMHRSEDPGVSPVVDDFHRVMHANIHHRRLQTAESYLQALLQLHRSSHHDRSSFGVYQPSDRTYNLIIAGYAKAERPHDANRILQQMLDDGFVADSSSGVPAYCFETCLNAWVASRHKSAGHRAETLILQMQRLGLRPSERSLAKVIAAWAQSKRSNAPLRAEAILRLLLSMAEDNDSPPNEGATNRGKVVLDAYLHVVRAFALTATRDPTAPDHCQRLMKELLTSNHVDLAPSKSGRNSSSTGNALRKLCALVCLAWARSKRRDSVKHIEHLFHLLEADFALPLDRFCRNTLLEAHARTGDGTGALRTWRRFFERAGNDSATPDVQSVNSVLLALHRSNDTSATLAAEDFWGRVRNIPSVKPNVVTFNVLLSLVGRSDNIETARRGEAYLAELMNLYREGDSACRPNQVTYTKAIELWVNIKKSHHAEAMGCVQEHWVSMQRQRMKPSDATLKAYLDIQQRMK